LGAAGRGIDEFLEPGPRLGMSARTVQGLRVVEARLASRLVARIALGEDLESLVGQWPLISLRGSRGHLRQRGRRLLGLGELARHAQRVGAPVLPASLLRGHGGGGGEHGRRRRGISRLREEELGEGLELLYLTLVPERGGDTVLSGRRDGSRAGVARLHELSLRIFP